MRVKFIANAPMSETYRPEEIPGVKFTPPDCDITPAPFMLKHYYDIHGKNPNVTWLLAYLVTLDSFEEIVEEIINEQPDIVGLSVFFWNKELQLAIGKKLKSTNPDITIVVGGPELRAHKDPDFFEKYPFIDYAVYGDGEKAFQQIIDYESGFLKSRESFVNIVVNEDKKYKVYPYEQIKDPEYLGTSVFLNQTEYIEKHIEYLENKGINRAAMLMAVEFARGCMYACTFCDWNQGLTNKVKRRKTDWREELLFFKKLNIRIRETDANFGQWPEDLQIYDFAAKLYEPDKNFSFIAWNTPKIKKDAAYQIMRTNLTVYKKQVFVSFQDIHENVLKLMDRPSVSWEDHVDMIKQLRKDVINDGGDPNRLITAQLMLGVAGQTYESIVETFYKLWTEAEVYRYTLNQWIFLSNMPVAEDKFYHKLHKLTWAPIWYPQLRARIPIQSESLDHIYKILDSKIQSEFAIKNFNFTTSIFSTATMSHIEIIAARILLGEITILTKNFHPSKIKNYRGTLKGLAKFSLDQAHKHWNIIDPLYKKYGFFVMGSYDEKTQSLSDYFKRI